MRNPNYLCADAWYPSFSLDAATINNMQTRVIPGLRLSRLENLKEARIAKYERASLLKINRELRAIEFTIRRRICTDSPRGWGLIDTANEDVQVTM